MKRPAGLLDFPVSAHPKVAQNGNLVFHGYSAGPGCSIAPALLPF